MWIPIVLLTISEIALAIGGVYQAKSNQITAERLSQLESEVRQLQQFSSRKDFSY